MKITNKHNLPEPILWALEAREKAYSKGNADISVTELINPPQIRLLTIKHENEIEIDASDLIMPLMGSALHKVLEMAPMQEGEIRERRYYKEHSGVMISGQIDRLYNRTLQDWKTVSAYEGGMLAPKPDKEAQVNGYAWLISGGVSHGELIMFCKDWKKNPIIKYKHYPPASIVVKPVRIWSLGEQHDYVNERVAMHFEADTPECTKEDQWYRDEKKGPQRCLHHCNVRKFCPQFDDEKRGKVWNPDRNLEDDLRESLKLVEK